VAPGCKGGPDTNHTKVLVEEHDVDRITHEARVHGTCPVEEEPFTGGERESPDEAAESGERAVGHRAPLAYDRRARASADHVRHARERREATLVKRRSR
jgi:hypothetical protein